MHPFKASHIETIDYEIFRQFGIVDILRDDLIHPVVCGNKWRKLKFVIDHLLEHKFEMLVTFGGAYSNHVVATAFAGHHFKIKTHAFIRGDEKRELNHYEKLCIENEMTLTHVSRSDYRDKRKLFEQSYGQDGKAFFLDEGGNHLLGMKGCGEIIDELNLQYDYIILPTGTGTTMEGLLQRLQEKGLPTKVIGISALKNNFDLDKKMSRFSADNWHIFHDYHRGKYGSVDDELKAFIHKFMTDTNIPLETVYTGKMMMGFIDLIANGYFKDTDKVLLIHTGGLLNVQAY